MFHLGQQVICINDVGLRNHSDLKDVVRGCIYTIRDIVYYDEPDHPEDHGVPGLLLEEVVNDLCVFEDGYIGEPAFLGWRFRPVKKTDISIFMSLLEPTEGEKVGT